MALAAPIAVHAAGLGRLTVFSPLGQPLNAEIEIVALRPGEEDTLSARVAPREAFEAAGIEPSAVLSTVRFAVERRDSRRILRVTTSQPVNEPFVELLVELQWHNGRLVREYTFLLDPPEYKPRDALAAPVPKPATPAQSAALPPLEPAKPAAEVEAKPEPVAPAPPPLTVAPAPAPAAESEKPAPAVEPEKPAAGVEVVKEPAKEESPQLLADEPGVYEVMQGDTLGKIARDKLPPGITLNQMLVAIYRANQDAFIRENLNLVRAGRILNIPGSDAVGTVDVEEANRVVRAHMAEFREYRGRLAAAPAVADAASGQREAAGQIEAKPQAPKPAAAEDQVRLSKVDPQKPSTAAKAAARGDDLAAQDRALKEAQSRIGDLEKNVADLQKLLELKNQQLAELEQRAGAKPAAPPASAPAPAAKGPETPQPAAPAPSSAPTSVAQAPEKPAPASASTPAVQAPVASQPAAPPPAVKAAPKKMAPPPEPSLLDEFLENPVSLAGLAGVVVLLLGYAAWAWRKKKTAQARFQDSVIGAAAAGAAAGASISEPSISGAGPTSSQTSSGAPPAAMAGEEVDPIAEADVYLAYGRDAQAEEILKEALQKDAKRVAVHAKLLEIYAKRRDTKAFAQSAAKLKNLTGGSGPEWEKAAALGKSIDPSNGLYAGAATAAAAAAAAEVSAPSPSAPALDFDVGSVTQVQAAVPDFTLDLPAQKAAANTGLDFDLSGTTTKKDVFTEDTVVPASAADKNNGLDFDLDLGTPAASGAKREPAATAPAVDPGLSFDLNLEKTDVIPAAATATDFSTISLELGSPGSASAVGTDPKWQEIATKLDLAKAYEEMGDKDGARELLNEVMKDGDAAQKGQAQQLLVKLG
ncbi:MAG TPA: FimV/HubP family polar landmark protein [Burkholderiales bacterium]|nr:FimV/HubP family polar landmark protein [Burkholderiales bacterium]